MPARSWIAPVLLLAGFLLVADAARRGDATLHLVLVVPVVSGTSAEFILGLVLVALGFFLIPLAWGGSSERVSGPPDAPAPPSEMGGVVLLGPVPIFLGAFRNPPRWVFWAAVGIGAVLLAIALAVFLGV